MIIIYEKDLLNLTDYSDVEILNCYISKENEQECKKKVTQLKNAKTAYVITRDSHVYKSLVTNKYISKDKYPIVNFGYENYLSKDKKVLVISNLSLCTKQCKNCVSCYNAEYLTINPQIETLIINKVGIGGNAILNNLPDSLLHLRVGESVEDYELNNLPYSLEILELYDQKIINSEKIKLPWGCKLELITPIKLNFQENVVNFQENVE